MTPKTRIDAQRFGCIAWFDQAAGGYRFAWADKPLAHMRGRAFRAAAQAELAFRARRPRRIPIKVGSYPKQNAPSLPCGALQAVAFVDPELV